MEHERFRELITAPVDGTGFLFRGSGTEDKRSILVERCRYLLQNAEAGEGMLILAGNGSRAAEWGRELGHVYPVEPRICTFRSFVRQELDVFYPLAARHAGLVQTEVRPAFLDRDAAVDLVSKVVQHRREKDGIFSTLSSTSEKIASDILASLDDAAFAGIPHDEAFNRLYSSLEIKNEVRMKIYKDAGEIARAYRSKCLELGVLDMAASVELFCNHLLKDERYRNLLQKKIRYLIAESVQEWDEAQVMLAELLIPGMKGFALDFDPEAACGAANRLRWNKYIGDRLFVWCRIVDTDAAQKLAEDLPEVLFNTIVSGKAHRAVSGPVIERHPATELRSEMLEKLGGRVCELIENEGFKPSEIAIVSTYADIVTELVLAGILHKRGHGLENLAAGDKASDSRICRALLTFAGLCHPQYGIFPSRDDVRLLSEILFGLDSARACTLAAKACNTIPRTALPDTEWSGLSALFDEKGMEKYHYVTSWIDEYKKTPEAEISVFLQKALLEIFLETGPDEIELERAKQLTDRAGDFCRIITRFGRNAGRDFAGIAGRRMNVGVDRNYTQENETGKVILATPPIYLGSGLKSRVTVICGLSSKNWTPVRNRELVNPNVLSAAWEKDRIYATEIEEADRLLYLADTIRAIVSSCGERLVTFESLLNGNGYENDGILPEIFEIIH